MTLREGLRLTEAGVVSPLGRGCRQHKSHGEVTPAGPWVAGWVPGKVMGTRKVRGTELD